MLDPFCGTGTTLVEAKKNSIQSIGIEATPMAFLASKTKTTWDLSGQELRHAALNIMNNSLDVFSSENGALRKLSKEQDSILLKNSIEPLPLHKCLVLRDAINGVADLRIRRFFLLALAYVAVHKASNLKFGPEVGVRRKKRTEANVFGDWFSRVNLMTDDIESGYEHSANASCYNFDSRDLNGLIENGSIDAVITSPPYPNEKDYTRTTRLESTLLGFLENKSDLRRLKQFLLRSNTRNVYISDDDDLHIEQGSKIDRIANEIERRRLALNKTSGFERQYHRVTRLYFGGMKRHLAEMRKYLKPGARMAYVVGDQASYLQVLIRTGELLAETAHELGYHVSGIDLFRTRISTATGQQLREEVLLLEWPDKTNGRRSLKERKNRYDQLIERAFFDHYTPGAGEVFFDREEFETIAAELKIKLPKNLGDIIYSYRYRNVLPEAITELLSKDEEWIIRSVGRGKYKFSKSAIHRITPNPRLSKIKILDATPEIIRRYALNDEQALLAVLRYNRLIDTFLGFTCYSLQNHLRTTVKGIGQVETDELYVGVSKDGKQYIVPVQAKGRTDQLGIVQIEQDFAVCESKFPDLLSRPVAAQFIQDDLIALFEFEKNGKLVTIREEKHYQLVSNTDLPQEEIKRTNAQ